MRRWKEKFIKIYEYCIIEDNYVHFLMVEVVIYEDFKHEKWRKWKFELLTIFRMNKNNLMQEIQPRNTRGWNIFHHNYCAQSFLIFFKEISI